MTSSAPSTSLLNDDVTVVQMRRAHSAAFHLGAPLTNEYDIGTYRAQGFTSGIVYARIGDWANVRHVTW